MRPNEDLCLTINGYTIILESNREALSEALAAATAFLWEEQSRKKPTATGGDLSLL